MEHWFSSGACDGFMMQFHTLPGGLAEFVDGVIPRAAAPRPVPHRLRRQDAARAPRPAATGQSADRRAARFDLDLAEVDCGGVGTAQQHTDPLALGRTISTRHQRGEGGRTARLEHLPQARPQLPLGFGDGIVTDQHDGIDISPRDREHQIADATGTEAVSRQSRHLDIDRCLGGERREQRVRRGRLDADDADATLVPRRNATDQSAAADRDQQRVDVRCLGFELQSDRTLAEQCLGLIVGMDPESAGLFWYASQAAAASA